MRLRNSFRTILSLLWGILGGSAGTTLDAFQLLHDAKKHGARVALFGRKINLSEHPLAFIEMLRLIADGKIEPEEAVKLYHDKLAHDKIPAARSIKDDLQITQGELNYGTTKKAKSGSARSLPKKRQARWLDIEVKLLD